LVEAEFERAVFFLFSPCFASGSIIKKRMSPGSLNQFFGEAIGLLMSWSMTAAVLLELMRRSNNWRTPRNLSPRGRAVHVVFEVTT
jgi:hypothetical protein